MAESLENELVPGKTVSGARGQKSPSNTPRSALFSLQSSPLLLPLHTRHCEAKTYRLEMTRRHYKGHQKVHKGQQGRCSALPTATVTHKGGPAPSSKFFGNALRLRSTSKIRNDSENIGRTSRHRPDSESSVGWFSTRGPNKWKVQPVSRVVAIFSECSTKRDTTIVKRHSCQM